MLVISSHWEVCPYRAAQLGSGDMPLSKCHLQCPSSVENVGVQRSGDLAGLYHTTTVQSHDGVRLSLHGLVFLQQAWIPYSVITVTLEKQSKRQGKPHRLFVSMLLSVPSSAS